MECIHVDKLFEDKLFALPTIQRPYLWDSTRAADFFDRFYNDVYLPDGRARDDM